MSDIRSSLINFLKRAFVPGAAFIGAGLSAIGAIYTLPWLTFWGALIAAFAVLTSAVWQAESSEKIEKQSDIIVEQSRRIESLITGGDGFCYIAFSPTTNPAVFAPVAINGGQYPLYEISARIVDVTAASAMGNSPQAFAQNEKQWPIGSIAVAAGARLPYQIAIPALAIAQDYNIFFSGRNGFWTQLQRFRKGPGGNFEFAQRVLGAGGKVLYEANSSGYPLNSEGKVDW